MYKKFLRISNLLGFKPTVSSIGKPTPEKAQPSCVRLSDPASLLTCGTYGVREMEMDRPWPRVGE